MCDAQQFTAMQVVISKSFVCRGAYEEMKEN